MHNWADIERITFLESRDTTDEVYAFVKQCVIVYRKATLAAKQKHGKRGVYRQQYIQSYLFHKRWLENKDAL